MVGYGAVDLYLGRCGRVCRCNLYWGRCGRNRAIHRYCGRNGRVW